MAARDICTRANVTALVPGYVSDVATDSVIDTLITAESRAAHKRAGREFKAIASNNTRRFDLGPWQQRNRRVRIGDLASATTVKIIDADQTTAVETVASANYVLWPRVREEWQPITAIDFPAGSPSPASLWSGRVLEVAGTWGFPSLPEDLVTAVAKMVLVRYLADAAASGTALSDALNEQGFNAAQAFASAREVIDSYRAPAVA